MKKNFSTQRLHLVAVISTLIVSRVALWLTWQESWMTGMKADTWHHSYTGVLLAIGAWFIFRKYSRIQAIATGIGLGLVFDEITTPLCWFEVPIEYWSPWSWGSASMITVGYVLWRISNRTRGK